MQISVNSKYHALLAGRKREALNAIMHQTETNFYFPIPFTVLNPAKPQATGNSSTVGEVDTYQNTIFITGEADNIQEASKRYLDLVKDLVCLFPFHFRTLIDFPIFRNLKLSQSMFRACIASLIGSTLFEKTKLEKSWQIMRWMSLFLLWALQVT